MTAEQFKVRYEDLRKQKNEIDDKIMSVKEEFLESLPFKEGDCIRITSPRHGVINKAWASSMCVAVSKDTPYINFLLVEARRNGTPSKRITEASWIALEEIELLEGAK